MAEEEPCMFWIWAMASTIFRLFLIFFFPENINASSRPELSTPLTSLRRLAEGYWLKQSSLSPYAGSMYHGSPLLLSILGPLTIQRIEGKSSHHLCRYPPLWRYCCSCAPVESFHNTFLCWLINFSDRKFGCHCVSFWSITRRVPLAAFGLVMATHLSLYSATLAIPLIFLLGYGLDAPPVKKFLQTRHVGVETTGSTSDVSKQDKLTQTTQLFLWRTVLYFVFWVLVWSSYVLVLCSLSLKQYGGLEEMFKRTYGFILRIEDLSPNIGVFWYFFAEVFDFSRNYLLIVFNLYILLTGIPPLAFRLKHRPCFLAFAYLAFSSILKSYPSVGDAALYLSLWALFVNELTDMEHSFFIFCGYIGFSLLSPVMHNIWIWRGTGNANFYFGNAMGYACFQYMFVEKSVNAMLNHDQALKKATSEMTKN
ncbi:phosphatidylinositol glycan anchor biosynthesis class U protein isoform X1 [Arabidopsis lyrata subsp. lyrata]|uniref:phosphatidylinositol glycan anchor biosynthesis class U protein isoform X1 n=1 Tax=Arabidopsis lyrata subsp. lyrata TaxID=81972 RepID=UPI000A29CC22|nr:phosphatidylinositol glycan anchor biosynthesis class U protein isoform X1 [Arabidopsis lyrata subsp. lyrata]|eukprot:XP_020869515.1 phosphatidylinositol glycan anchor biosynthesis class U protein isoform X1 [Arabidopsis lyrata subsp. lyrata]